MLRFGYERAVKYLVKILFVKCAATCNIICTYYTSMQWYVGICKYVICEACTVHLLTSIIIIASRQVFEAC